LRQPLQTGHTAQLNSLIALAASGLLSIALGAYPRLVVEPLGDLRTTVNGPHITTEPAIYLPTDLAKYFIERFRVLGLIERLHRIISTRCMRAGDELALIHRSTTGSAVNRCTTCLMQIRQVFERQDGGGMIELARELPTH